MIEIICWPTKTVRLNCTYEMQVYSTWDIIMSRLPLTKPLSQRTPIQIDREYALGEAYHPAIVWATGDDYHAFRTAHDNGAVIPSVNLGGGITMHDVTVIRCVRASWFGDVTGHVKLQAKNVTWPNMRSRVDRYPSHIVEDNRA